MTDFALALGGGGARGLAHIHVLQALDDLGITPAVVSGSSMGALIGGGYCSGMSAAEIHDHVLSALANPVEAMRRLWRARPGNMTQWFNRGVPLLGELSPNAILQEFLPEKMCRDFSELKIPLKVTAVDYYAANLSVLEEGNLVRAIAASVAIPGIFKPVTIEGRVLVDGGFMSPVPFELLGDKGEIVIGVDVVGVPEHGDTSKTPSRLEIAFGASQLMMQSIIQTQLKIKRPQLLVCPPVGHIGVLDFLKARKILEQTASVREEVKRDIENILDPNQKQIASHM